MFKIFAISDMHSYLTPTLKALKDAGWDENNSKHIIVVCGDALDRGNETAEMVERGDRGIARTAGYRQGTKEALRGAP